MFDKILNIHRNPWTQIFHLVAFIVGVYGLWMHDWWYIGGAVVIALLSHGFPCKKKGKKK